MAEAFLLTGRKATEGMGKCIEELHDDLIDGSFLYFRILFGKRHKKETASFPKRSLKTHSVFN